MAQRRKFSAEYKCEAVAMLDAPGVRVGQIAADLGIGAAHQTVLPRKAPWIGTASDSEFANLVSTDRPTTKRQALAKPTR